MKAVAYYQSLPIDHPEALVGPTLPESTPGPRDLFVEVRATSVNPVDVKVRLGTPPVDGQPHVLGWDAAGAVHAVNAEVSLFKSGDVVWHAGVLQRPGTNSELYVVDERVAGAMPVTFGPAQAAALPPTVITVWELLFNQL